MCHHFVLNMALHHEDLRVPETAEMSPTDQEKLVAEHLMFGACDEYLTDGGACQHWPHGRGIFINHERTFVVWVGEEDHLRIIR